MDKLIKLIVVAVILYFGVTVGYPKLKEALGSGSTSSGTSEDGGGDRCVSAARGASDRFVDRAVPLASPPMDPDRWFPVSADVGEAVSEAQSDCSCGEESCRKASRALDRLQSMLSELDQAADGGNPPLNLAAAQNEVDDLLNEARRLARSGD